MSKSCANCRNCVVIENGYSNWTVEGADFFCDVGAHPDAPFDYWYGQDACLDHAETCPSFIEGPHRRLDVEHDLYAEDPAFWDDFFQRYPGAG